MRAPRNQALLGLSKVRQGIRSSLQMAQYLRWRGQLPDLFCALVGIFIVLCTRGGQCPVHNYRDLGSLYSEL